MGEFHRIAEQVDQHLAQFWFIRNDITRHMLNSIGMEGQAGGFCFLTKYNRQVAKQGLQVKSYWRQGLSSGFNLGNFQNIIKKLQQVLAVAVDDLQMLFL